MGDTSGKLAIYDQNLNLSLTINAHLYQINRVKSSNGLVATASDDNSVKVWNVSNNQWSSVCNLTGFGSIWTGQSVQNSAVVTALQFVNDSTIMWGHPNGYIVLYSIPTSTFAYNQLGNEIYALSQVFGANLIAVGLQETIKIISLPTLSPVFSLYDVNTAGPTAHTSFVTDFELTQNGALLISASLDKTIKVWSMSANSGSLLFTLSNHSSAVYSLKMVSSSILASGSIDTTIKLWNIISGTLIQTLTGHTSFIVWSIDSSDFSTIISGAHDKSVKVWDASTGNLLKSISTPFEIKSLAIVTRPSL